MQLKSASLKEKKVIAAFLKISGRTLDRYLKKHNLGTLPTISGKKLVNFNEFLAKIYHYSPRQVETTLDKLRQIETNLVKKNQNNNDKIKVKSYFKKITKNRLKIIPERQNIKSQDNNIVLNKTKRQVETSLDKIRQIETNFDVENFYTKNLSNLTEYKKELEIYKKLYNEQKLELKLKQERIEGATYHIGQLEAQLKNSIPLLSYRQKEEEMIKLNEKYKNEIQEQKEKIAETTFRIQNLRFINHFKTVIFISFLFFFSLFIIIKLTP